MNRFVILGVLCLPLVSIAQTPTTAPEVPTPQATATPLACQIVQSCVDAGISAVLGSCSAATPECVVKSSDRFGVSAVALARRAIDDLAKCGNKIPSKASAAACRSCYEKAAAPYKIRVKGILFHGLLAQTVDIINAEKKAVCRVTDNSSSRGQNKDTEEDNSGEKSRRKDR